MHRLVFVLVLAVFGCSDDAGPAAELAESASPEVTSVSAKTPGDGLRPYDEDADAAVDVAAAQAAAQETGKLLLINFGANWCTDCRVFEAACRDPEIAAAIDAHFVTAKVDVGNWDKHPEVVAAWGDPIAGGIPAVVVATAQGEVLFSTKAGQLARARHMGRDAFIDFFQQLARLDDDSSGG